MSTRILLYATMLAAPMFLAPGLAAATAATDGEPVCHAQLVPAVLPHTPDAIEGWFRACYQRQGGLEPIGESACHAQLVPGVLPHTPDAIEGWFRACYEHQGGLETTDQPDNGRRSDNREARNGGGVVPGWMPRDPPPDWRRLMNEIEPDPDVDGPRTDWRRLVDEVDTLLPKGSRQDIEPGPATEDGSIDYGQVAAGGLAGAMIVTAVAATLARRRPRRLSLEAVVADGDPAELPRAAGLLGDCFVQQSRAGAAEHAYWAAVDVGDPYWSPIAQVALAHLLSDRGERAEAQALLEAAVASGHPRAAPMAQASLGQLLAGGQGPHRGHQHGNLIEAETLGDSGSAHYQVVGTLSPIT